MTVVFLETFIYNISATPNNMDRNCKIKDYFLSLPEEGRFHLFRKLRHELVQPMHTLYGYSDLISRKLPHDQDLMQKPGMRLFLDEIIELNQTLRLLTYQMNEIKTNGNEELNSNLTKLEDLFIKTITPFTDVQINGENPKLRKYHSSMKSAKGCLRFTLSELFNCQESEGFYFHQFLNLVHGINREIFEDRNIKFYNSKKELITSLSYGSTLSSLIGNSIKHTTATEIRVNIKEIKMAQSYIVSVEDNGSGINPFVIYQVAVNEGIIKYDTQLNDYQRLQLVFEKGVKTEYSNANGILSNIGTSEGLGLSAIKESIEGKEGQVWVDKLDRGVCFCFSVPKKWVIDYK